MADLSGVDRNISGKVPEGGVVDESLVSVLLRTDVEIDGVPTGYGFILGNKGGVGIQIMLQGARMLFITCHLSAHQDCTEERNEDYRKISSGIFFPERLAGTMKRPGAHLPFEANLNSFLHPANMVVADCWMLCCVGDRAGDQSMPAIEEEGKARPPRVPTHGWGEAPKTSSSSVKRTPKRAATGTTAATASYFGSRSLSAPTGPGTEEEFYDLVIWSGDLNYRVEGNRQSADVVIQKRMIEVLKANDQLTREMRAGHVFQGYKEGPINFLPTYKYDSDSDNYDTTPKESSPYTTEQQEKMAAIVKENRERKEREKQAKLKAIADERAAKMKEVEEEMKKKEQAAEEAAAEEEKERMRIESREGSSGTKKDTDAEIEKKISEWVANLSLGEDEEAESYVIEDEKAALAAELATMTDPMERREREDEQKLQWKLRMKREKRRRRKEVNKMTATVAKVQECRAEVLAQPDDKAKWDKVLGYLEVLSKAWMEERQARWSQDVALSAMRSGFRELAREIVTHIGGEVKQLRDNVGKYCEGAIEGAKAIAAAEGEGRPRKEPLKLKFPDAYGGKKEENFDNWEASVNSYIYLQHILTEEQVLVAFHALKDEAASFARSLARTAGCENNLVAYSKVTPLSQFLKLLKERFADPTRGIRASDKLQTIHSRQWRSAKALKGTMDDLVAVPDHGVTEPLLVQLFYRAIPEALRGHFFDKSQQAGMTYDALSREVVLYESKFMPVTTFWHKDLEKGKKWKTRTISGHVKAKDHMILTLEEGGTDEVPYDQIEWGLEDDGSSVGQGRSYAAVAAGGRPQGGGGGQGQRGQALGGRGPGAQGARVPSWTDRILYKVKSNGCVAAKLLKYDSINSVKISDHRPVFAIFKVKVYPSKKIQMEPSVLLPEAYSGYKSSSRKDGFGIVEDVKNSEDRRLLVGASERGKQASERRGMGAQAADTSIAEPSARRQGGHEVGTQEAVGSSSRTCNLQ
ncbi:hypothetical protein CBR_g24225 [Chara braunii]|uniref:Inositol polyphosphate-related phosphatase domain-containing protein n=1 Tax=Chara braunii TaxID=69332 RepID=A0A388L651_CHABU|nr:hypothetical protein CBR_g24225 [Chara braunii]|eukprot:GBG77777.1 hypothetical protein CBR_g24225 [Chara braunii]